ncbi:hypothetical conserved protein [Rhizobium etli CFN 42]|nr:hypothetical conserved protein [Rhizobium etli CFN 42]
MGWAARYTPLCPAGHLPHKEGDRQDAPACQDIDRAPRGFGQLRRLIRVSGRSYPISPLVGEMPGRAEGGAAAAPSRHRERQAMPHAPVPPQRRANARRMRKALTEAELKLWNELRAHRLMGLSFRRQMPIAGYIVDFACPSRRLIVEIDGSQHALAPNVPYDPIRTQRLQADGWTVLRFWNDDILRDIDNVCSHIIRIIGKDLP